MMEFIVSWSAYGPSGRIEATTQELATRMVEEHLWALGLETQVLTWTPADPVAQWDGHFVILRSTEKRYGDMASFGVCVYEVGQKSFYDVQRERLETHKQEVARAAQ